MKKRWIYTIAVIFAAASLTALVIWTKPTQQEQIASIRQSSNRFLVITRDFFLDALQPWQARRKQQGYEVIVKSFQKAPAATDIIAWINESNAHSKEPCRFIMLVGDSGGVQDVDTPWYLPVNVGPMGYKYEDDEAARPIVSDAPYGDIDNDGQIEVAVGRLPVRTVSELDILMTKMVQYETSFPDPQYYRAAFWTGGKYYHQSMHNITLQFIQYMLPEWLYPYLISSFPESVCSGVIEEQPARFLKAFSQPSFINLVVGHGDYNNLRCIEKDGEELPLRVEQVSEITSATANGPLILVACDTGSFHLPTDKGPCMAEAFILHPGGPVAVIGAAGYMNVVANYYFAGSIANYIKSDSGTIGDLLVDSRQILYKAGKYTLKQIREHDTRTHALLDPPSAATMALYTKKNLIREEGLLYNLLGDPSLVLNRPRPMAIDVSRLGHGHYRLSGDVPPDADWLWVQHYDLNRLKQRIYEQIDDEQRRRIFDQANAPPAILARQPLKGRSWQVTLQLEDTQLRHGNKIRIMAIGKRKVYSHTLAMPIQTVEH